MTSAVEERNREAILTVMNTAKLVVKIRPKKNSGPYGLQSSYMIFI